MDDLSPQEHAVYAMVAANPFAGQADIAETLGLDPATVDTFARGVATAATGLIGART